MADQICFPLMFLAFLCAVFIEHLVMPLKPVLFSVSVLEPVSPVSGEKQASSDLGTQPAQAIGASQDTHPHTS